MGGDIVLAKNITPRNIIIKSSLETILQKVFLRISEKLIEPAILKDIKNYFNYKLQNVSLFKTICEENNISKFKTPPLLITMHLENPRLAKDNWMRHQIPEKLNCKMPRKSHLELFFKRNLIR